ncbi:MAG: TonB-dependent receptor plug domain-containing protein [Gemmatimonadaceae bacterium]|nr:TonB-dependent receptor plug domain-containing protein [Gemmatimonadaceae bacterium]
MRAIPLILALTACTHSSTPAPAGGTSENIITQEELDASSAANAYEAIQKLRGNFLSDRGKTTLMGASSNKPTVYLDGVLYGEIQSLRNIPVRTVATIRLYRAWEAQQKYGTGKMGGVIEVTTRTQ